jgi:outer membrane protein TolC
MKASWVLAVVMILAPGKGYAGGGFGFQELWAKVRGDAAEIRATESERQASFSASERSARHWVPGFTLTGRGIHTNDPAQVFFSRLGQRSAEAADFNPSSLNHPGTANFVSTSLGMQWSLFEGGAGSAYRDLQRSMSDLKSLGKNRAEWEAYVETASAYGTILHAEATRDSVTALKGTVQGILSRYSVGSKSNPVGYSGLLGLKSLLNRVQAVEEQLLTEADTGRSRIRALSGAVPDEFQVRKEPLSVFMSVVLPESQVTGSDSVSVSLAEKQVELAGASIGLDRARALPQIGVFGEGGVVTGARNTGAAYAGGLYLRWSLFDPRDFGSLSEKRLEREAALARLEGARSAVRSGREGGLKSLHALERNEKLLQESLTLMGEQVEVASRLFQSGSISALQLVEVYNRRLDLLLGHQELQRQHIQIRAGLARLASGKGITE